MDNPDGYKAFIDKFNKVFDYDDIFINYFNHSNIADFFYNKNRNNYIYCKIKKEELFLYYNEHNILKDNAEIIITNEIKKQIEKELKTVLNNIKEQLKQMLNNEDENQKKIKGLLKLKLKLENNINTIGNHLFLENIIKCIKKLYYIENFENLYLNKNINIIAFNNGCYDYNIGKYRNINKSDYISITTGYNMPIHFEDYKIIYDLFFSFFEDEEIMNYNIDIIANSLFGNKNEDFYIFTGEGANGKGTEQDLIELALGEYFMAGNNDLLTGTDDQRNDTLSNAQNCRALFVSEPSLGKSNGKKNEDIKFNLTMIKKLTGGDTINVRKTLSSKLIIYKAIFKLFILCNRLPEIDENNNSTQRRFKFVHFPFNFVENPTKENEL